MFKSISNFQIFSHERLTTMASLIFLLGGFFGVISWFSEADIYYTHFFQPGFSIFIYNLFRIFFAFFLIWIIYAVGYGIISLLIPAKTILEFSLLERIVFGFGIGVGLWHVLLLILGVCNLYYRSLMIGLCVTVLFASATHFTQVIDEIRHVGMAQCRRGERIKGFNTLLIGIGVAWLFIVRGLYPGGGGDYFTHYFYYYTEVIRNHGLLPNDVWYHYYYSKGAGLTFLGMLLIDPEAPAIVTFCYVFVATLALTSLSSRIAPRSFWPAFCSLLYIFYNLVSLTGNGGEFQKTHEGTSALVIILVWAICMYGIRPKEWEKPTIITMATVVIAAAIITQATAIFFAVLFMVFAGFALWGKKWRQMWLYGLVTAVACVTVIAIFILNYFVTGLATDQAINLAWRFANVERLNQWGVIPNIFIVAWIRDNYLTMLVPWGWRTLGQLANFMRLDMLWVAFAGAMVALFFCFSFLCRQSRKPIITIDEDSSIVLGILSNVSIVICTFAILSVFAGRAQSVSFFRFSSFFVPLLILFCVVCWGFFINIRKAPSILSYIIKIIIPFTLIFAVLISWHSWFSQVSKVTKNARRFLHGRYSLAEAYKRQHKGLSFGGINPGTYEAMRHAPKGARIWSTNVDSYCMVPLCKIESVVSFKLSSQLNEILNGSPEDAKKKLQSEGLNYFLFSTKSQLLDLLPYGHLFKASTMEKYFAIKWTDGETFLLTWAGEPNTMPLGSAFLSAYKLRFEAPEHSWFKFSEAVPQMDKTMKQMMSSSHPWHPVKFPSPAVLHG